MAHIDSQTIKRTLAQTFSGWNNHNAPRLGAALAFYSILSLAPLVVLGMAMVVLVFSRSAAQNQLLAQAQGMLGPQVAQFLKDLLEHAKEPPAGIAAAAGAGTLLFGASGVFGELRDALNTMWDVTSPEGNGIWGVVKQRFLTFGMVLAVGFLLPVSLLISATLAAAGKFFDNILPLPQPALSAIDIVISWAAITVLFALIFRYVPAARIPWRILWIGAGVTSFLFTIGKSLIGFYLGVAAPGSAYGAAGSLVIVIVWVYYSAMIFLLGAEFTRVLDPTPGRRRTETT